MHPHWTTEATTLACIALQACSGGTVIAQSPPVDWHAFEVEHTQDAGPPGPTAQERAVAEIYAAAWASPGFPRLTESLDSDAHLEFPGISDARGRDDVLRAHQVLFGSFEQRTVRSTRVWRTASEQSFEWTMTGVHTRDWMGVPATGKSVAISGLTLLFTKDDGRITDLHVYFDVAVVRAQLGAAPELPLPNTPGAKQLVKELAAAGVARAGSPSVPQSFEQTGTAEEARNVWVARAWLKALEDRREPEYAALMSDDVEIRTLEQPRATRGLDAARSYFRSIHQAIGQLDTTIDNVWGVSHFAIVEYFIAGDQVGPLGWIPTQTDRVARMDCVDVLELRDGKIARVTRYDNPIELLSMP